MITIPPSLQAEHHESHKAPAHEQLAETLAVHAQTEEEILYPAAILVGDIIRARMEKK